MTEEASKQAAPENNSILSRLVLFLIKQSVLHSGEQPSPDSMWPLLAPVTADMTTLMRNVGYGGAATGLIIILSILQIGASTTVLKISAVAAAVGIPLWLVLGLIYESYLSLDPSVYPHQRTPLAQGIVAFVQGTAALTMFLSLFCLMHHIAPTAAWLFLVGEGKQLES